MKLIGEGTDMMEFTLSFENFSINTEQGDSVNNYIFFFTKILLTIRVN